MSQSDSSKKGIAFTVAALVGVAACIFGGFLASQWFGGNSSGKASYDFVGTVLNNSRPLSDFKLAATNDKYFDNKSLKGHWSMVFFGFTHCPVMCPTAMHELATTYSILEKNKVKSLPQVIMVSVDPERDTLKRMHEYVTGFNKSFIGAIGEDSRVRALSREMGIAYEKIASRDKKSENYDFQHSGAVIVLDPSGNIKAFFNWPHKPKDMADDYMHLVS